MGRIHSIETMGLVDGPGIRMVVFFQGCPIRCKFCHNPDTQAFGAGEEITAEEIIRRARSLRPYFKRSGGGVTISGGEPLAQPEFLLEVLTGLQKEGICAVVDTSGYGNPSTYDAILAKTNMVLLDIKHYDAKAHRDLVAADIKAQLPFIEALVRAKTRLWVRHVMVPGYTDKEETLQGLMERIEPLIDQIEKAEILPYHTLGVEKYKAMGKKYPLEGVPPMDKAIAKDFEKRWQAMIEYRKAAKGGAHGTTKPQRTFENNGSLQRA